MNFHMLASDRYVLNHTRAIEVETFQKNEN